MNGKTTLEIPADDRRPVMEYVSRSFTKIVNHSFFESHIITFIFNYSRDN